MAKKTFMPRALADRLEWLKNFSGKLGSFAAKYGISATEVSNLAADCTNAVYWTDYQQQFEEYLRNLTHYRDELFYGVPAGAVASVVPTPPAIPAAAGESDPGIFKRAIAIAKRIKSSKDYTEADGRNLGIEGADDTIDVQQMKPEIKLHLIAGGHPEIKWKKQGMDGIEIYTDHGTGTYVLLAYDTYPDYTDTAPLPAAGSSAVWNYKAIYRFDDAQAGLWSDVASITVTGV